VIVIAARAVHMRLMGRLDFHRRVTVVVAAVRAVHMAMVVAVVV
jgi:hypothetical protein